MSNLRIPGSSPMGSRATAADLRERPPTTEQQEESGLRPAETYGFLDSGTSNDGSDIDPRPADPNASLPLLPDTGTSYHVSDAENSPGFPALQTGHETGFVTPKDLHLNPDPLMDPVQKLYRPKPEITLSEAMEGVTPEAGSRPIDAPESHFEGLNLGEQEFALALPMDSRVRDDYETILRTERPSIREFLQQTSSDEDVARLELQRPHLTRQMVSLINRLNNVCIHSDLNRDGSQNKGQPTDEAAWAEYSSSKFAFLKCLIDAAATEAPHVIIMSKPGKTLELLETYLLGKEFIRTPPSSDKFPHELTMSKIDLSFGLRSTDDKQERPPFRPPGLIIALDSTFDALNPSVVSLRHTYSLGNAQLVPVLRLVIANSCEHVERCLPMSSSLSALRYLVRRTTEVADRLGDTQDFGVDLQESAKALVGWLKGPLHPGSWPLPAVPALREEQNDEEGSREGAKPISSLTLKLKRPASLEETASPGTPEKKPRLLPPSWRSIAQSHHATSPTPAQIGLGTSPVFGKQDIPKSPDNQQLLQDLADSQARLQRAETSLSELQHRYEARQNQWHKNRKELKKALHNVKRSEDIIQRLKKEVITVKDEASHLRTNLEDVRSTAKNEGQIQAELIELREQVKQLQEENAFLKRTAAQEKGQAEYTRLQYQNASTAAAQSANENRRLQEQMKQLEIQASQRAVQLAQIRESKAEETHLARIAELETMLESREELLNVREEELRELKKNRPSTRATSLQPRSRPDSPVLAHSSNNNHSNGSVTSNPSVKAPSTLRRVIR